MRSFNLRSLSQLASLAPCCSVSCNIQLATRVPLAKITAWLTFDPSTNLGVPDEWNPTLGCKCGDRGDQLMFSTPRIHARPPYPGPTNGHPGCRLGVSLKKTLFFVKGLLVEDGHVKLGKHHGCCLGHPNRLFPNIG